METETDDELTRLRNLAICSDLIDGAEHQLIDSRSPNKPSEQATRDPSDPPSADELKSRLQSLKHDSKLKALPKIYSLLIYQDKPKDGAVFRKDCEKLRDTLMNHRVTGASEDHVIVSSTDIAERGFISFILNWEKEIVENAHCALSSSFDSITKETIWHLYTFIRQLQAEKIVLQPFSGNALAKITPKFDNLLKEIMKIVIGRWHKWNSQTLSLEDKCTLLFAFTRLWSDVESDRAENGAQKYTTDAEKIIGNSHMREENKVVGLNLLKEVQEEEFKLLKALGATIQLTVLEELADYCFCTFVYSSGVPLDPMRFMVKHKDSFKRSVSEMKKADNSSKSSILDLPDLLKTMVANLKQIHYRSFWLHYSGHGYSDGVVAYTPVRRLNMMLRAAGKFVTNLIVTMDCCYADSTLSPVDFSVDGITNHSGCTTISACNRNQQADSKDFSVFTELVILALWSGLPGECFRLIDQVKPESCTNTRHCEGCKNYMEQRQEKPCMACKDLRDNVWREKGYVSVDDIVRYIGQHLCRYKMHPVITIHKPIHDTQLPVAHFNDSHPTYIISGTVGGNAFGVMTHSLPTKLKQAKEQVLGEILRRCLNSGGDHKARWKDITRSLSCPLVECIAEEQGDSHVTCLDKAWSHWEPCSRDTPGSASPISEYYSHSSQVTSPYFRRLENTQLLNERTVLDRFSFYAESGDEIVSDDGLKMAFLRSNKGVLCRIDLPSNQT